jgi:hypothetical protein
MVKHRENLLNEHQVAEWLNLSVWTLRRWRVKGSNSGPKFVKVAARRIAYCPPDVQAYIDSRTFSNTSQYEVMNEEEL